MFEKSSTIGLIVLATLLSVSQTQAQQNSTVFPWNSGNGGGTTPQYNTSPQYVTPPVYLPTAPPAEARPLPRPDAGGAEESSFDESGRAFIQVRVPSNAEIWFDDDKTKQTGSVREFVSPVLDSDKRFVYNVRARWTAANGQVVDQTRPVKVEAGRRSRVDFSTPAPSSNDSNPKSDKNPKS
jgi:uncharacterized protein (TIGR03000 family)